MKNEQKSKQEVFIRSPNASNETGNFLISSSVNRTKEMFINNLSYFILWSG